MYVTYTNMSDLDFVIFVTKSDKCMDLLEKIDERLAAYNKRGMRILIKKVYESNLPEGVTAVPECNIKGAKTIGIKAIINGLDKICRPRQKEANPDDLENYYNSQIGSIDDAKADAAKGEDDVDDTEMTKSEIDRRMADAMRKAPAHRRNGDDDLTDEPAPRNNRRQSNRRQADSDDEESDDDYDEPEDNIRETNPDEGLDLDEEMKRIINGGD